MTDADDERDAVNDQLKQMFEVATRTLTVAERNMLIDGLTSTDRTVAEEYALKLIMMFKVATSAKVREAIAADFY